MKHYQILFISALVILSCSERQEDKSMNQVKQPTTPIAAKKDSVLLTHGDSRVDPYFWMRLTDEQKIAENPDAQTQEVVAYLEAENSFIDQTMTSTEKFQEKLYDEIVGRIKKDDESVPYFDNGYWYYQSYQAGKEYPIYARKKGVLTATEEIILDVNKLAKPYEYYSAAGLAISPDNKILAFAEDTLSRRVYTYRFIDLSTGEFLTDVIQNSEPGAAWANDNKTFFYTTKNETTLLSEKIWKHKITTDQSDDVVVFHEKDPSFYIGVGRSKSGQYVVIYEGSTDKDHYLILNADTPDKDFLDFTERQAKHKYSISHYQDIFYIVTDDEAPNYRLMKTPEAATSKDNWSEVIPHRKDVLLDDIEVFNDFLVVQERANALTHLRIIDQQSKEEHYLEFDEPAYVVYASTNPEFNTNYLRFGYSSLSTPNSIYDYDMGNRTKVLKKRSEVIGGHDPAQYTTERVYAEARDGTQIPVSIVYKKGIDKNGTAPLLQYAYGSYGASTDPWFSSVRLSLLDRGFIFAIAHIRGGQEMGRQWYEDGKMFKKKNTFNDFVDVSKYLINEKYTSAGHLYAQGGSAGGLLMGAIVNQAPELYNGIIAAVPFVDVVSTMLDESIPLTTGEFDEWGNPMNLESYEYMLSYSPYDQVSEQDYPNMLVTTGYFDSQVQYWEPAKWVAKLRDKKTDDNLLLFHTNMDAGHGGASGRFKKYKETALQYAFFFKLENIQE
ncbi:MAG: oligopeptidase B [Cyclobacteriaceae bacterium]|jgi:oligopeptidase B